ncbi:hypothetical protein MNB_SM-5-180 [hydrothermal vent metagenome]|uniref:Uncharacterized protein n=1 Tax=hydrothermal vent metagenome TaxID=652676 RepID=A0A1W1CY45_9ZZZZ
MKLLIILLIGLFFSACNIGETKKAVIEKHLQEKKVATAKIEDSEAVKLKKIDAKMRQDLANIEKQKELAKIDKEQMMEKIRLQTEVQKQKIILQAKKEKALLDVKMMQMKYDDAMETKRTLFLLAFFLISIISFFIYYFFKKRHEDKLRAYQDNLDKYFHQQENMTRMRIAEKIIDSVASGKLDKAQENALINALSGNIEPKHLEESDKTIALIEEKREH